MRDQPEFYVLNKILWELNLEERIRKGNENFPALSLKSAPYVMH